FGLVLPGQCAEYGLGASVLRRSSLLWDHRRIAAAANKIRPIEMVERRDCQQHLRTQSPHPGEVHKGVALAFSVTLAGRLSLGVIWNLIVITANGADQPQLIAEVRLVDQRPETADAICIVMQNLRCRGLQAKFRVIAAQAGVVRKAIRM